MFFLPIAVLLAAKRRLAAHPEPAATDSQELCRGSLETMHSSTSNRIFHVAQIQAKQANSGAHALDFASHFCLSWGTAGRQQRRAAQGPFACRVPAGCGCRQRSTASARQRQDGAEKPRRWVRIGPEKRPCPVSARPLSRFSSFDPAGYAGNHGEHNQRKSSQSG